jgi:REP element-mobilizing transposase RayT
MIKFKHHTEFTTITNYNWLPVLSNDYHKDIVIEALRKRVSDDQVTIYAYVIMPNHLHIIWQLHDHLDKACFKRDFLKFTARSILAFLRMHDDPLLKN